MMQSDWNGFWGDIALDSFNKVYMDEDDIFDEIFKMQFLFYFYDYLNFNNIKIFKIKIWK